MAHGLAALHNAHNGCIDWEPPVLVDIFNYLFLFVSWRKRYLDTTYCCQFILYNKLRRTRATGRRDKAGKQKLGNAPLSSAFYQWICCWTETRHLEKLFGYLALSQESCTSHTRANGASAQHRQRGGLVASQSQRNLVDQIRWTAAEVQPGQNKEWQEINIMF